MTKKIIFLRQAPFHVAEIFEDLDGKYYFYESLFKEIADKVYATQLDLHLFFGSLI